MKNYFLLLISAFSLNASAQYTKLFDFAGSGNGSYTRGSLVSDGTFLYGTTPSGGSNNGGTIFKIMPDGTGYFKLLDFTGPYSNGKQPYGSLISDGTYLYGMTKRGGTNDMGVLFKIKLDGTGYIKLLDFVGTTNGSYPYGSLFFDGSFLYGMTSTGGTNDLGIIFKIKPDGTGFVDLLDFAGTTNGSNPFGSLISDGIFLYGMTQTGGINGLGNIFKIKPDGTAYADLVVFSGTANGSQPCGSLISDGTFLYGMTQTGGTNSLGNIFKVKYDGSGYVNLLDFTGVPDGGAPYGSLISDGTFLYGMTLGGGVNNMGVIFKIKPDGSSYGNMLDFAGAANGSSPYGDLLSDGTFLYGMTSLGGTNSLGTIFSLAFMTTGIISNNQVTDFNIYPNPSSGIFKFDIDKNATSKTNLEIYNLLGEKVFEKLYLNQQTSNEIDLSSSPKGIYFVKIIESDKVYSKKIVVQ